MIEIADDLGRHEVSLLKRLIEFDIAKFREIMTKREDYGVIEMPGAKELTKNRQWQDDLWADAMCCASFRAWPGRPLTAENLIDLHDGMWQRTLQVLGLDEDAATSLVPQARDVNVLHRLSSVGFITLKRVREALEYDGKNVMAIYLVEILPRGIEFYHRKWLRYLVGLLPMKANRLAAPLFFGMVLMATEYILSAVLGLR